ncbi:MAG TPA: hypothetical protein VFU46_14685 [Gemmatimonadales bacterium]|nr:hypothetical protein [Gemmatimonadales bacterium]
MTPRRALLALAALAGCGNLTEAGGVAGLEVRVPRPPEVEVAQTLVLQAKALDRQGDSVAVPVTWLTPDTTVVLTSDGRLTGRTGGTNARVQAQAGALVSDFVTFAVRPRPDTLVLGADSIQTVAAGVAASGPLVVTVRSFAPPEPLSGRTVTFSVAEPAFADPAQRTVELPGGVLTLAATTGSDGTPAPAVTLSRVAGQPAPDSAVVTVAATTATGALVPGSGQRFIVRFD